jgi:hypothetical protein
MKSRILPGQRIGSSTGAKVRLNANSRTEAIRIFQTAKDRLSDINGWRELCGGLSATFTLTDSNGNPVNRKPEKGDLIRIDLPAPGNEAGDGYDWVRIEEFENRKNELGDEEIFGFRVRPVSNPKDAENESAHFYSNAATSTFLVTRNTNIVVASEKGRNEQVNTGVKGFFNKVRNFIIAITAMLGLAKPQWKSLMRGVLYGAPS